MRQYQKELTVRGRGRGLYEFTDQVEKVVAESGIRTGVATIYVCHTSASLLIQENADPSARQDLEACLDRLAPENDPLYTHTSEGADDMPAHLKAALTNTSEQIPIADGRLARGTWQGLYLWEHRRRGGARRILVHIIGD